MRRIQMSLDAEHVLYLFYLESGNDDQLRHDIKVTGSSNVVFHISKSIYIKQSNFSVAVVTIMFFTLNSIPKEPEFYNPNRWSNGISYATWKSENCKFFPMTAVSTS